MKKGRILILLLALVLPAPVSLSGSSVPEALAKLYAQGNSEYQRGSFGEAERLYRQILSEGVSDGPVLYNLGNACFKQKKLGEAIYYWEKALQQMPSDREIRENLELANLMVVDRIETSQDPLPVRVFSGMLHFFTMEQERWIVFGLFMAGNCFLTICLVARRPRNSYRALIASLVVGVLFLIFGGSLTWKIYDRSHRQEGIVIGQKVDVRSGPGTENITVFTIHEGIRVRVLGSANGWLQISLPNGWNGWLPFTEVRVL